MHATFTTEVRTYESTDGFTGFRVTEVALPGQGVTYIGYDNRDGKPFAGLDAHRLQAVETSTCALSSGITSTTISVTNDDGITVNITLYGITPAMLAEAVANVHVISSIVPVSVS